MGPGLLADPAIVAARKRVHGLGPGNAVLDLWTGVSNSDTVWRGCGVGRSPLRSRHRRTLAVIFEDPTPANMEWRDVLGLFIALGGDVSEGRGSRVRVSLHGARAVFHRPHPEKEVGKAMVRSIRDFLENAGIR
jgi:hypothetical protein